MKEILYIFLILPFLTIGCSNDDDASFKNPVSQLPPPTQTGENTLGCLVNGEVFLPKGTSLAGPVLDCVYQYVDGGYYFGLQGNRRVNGILQAIGVGTRRLQINEGEIYQLLENLDGNANGAWYYPAEMAILYTSETHSGELEITKLDESENIVSGTFWYDLQLPDGEIVEVREGRFDMQYTN